MKGREEAIWKQFIHYHFSIIKKINSPKKKHQKEMHLFNFKNKYILRIHC